jgi:hypothetical protein
MRLEIIAPTNLQPEQKGDSLIGNSISIFPATCILVAA